MTVIRVAHSPDADDAFMFYALAHHKVDTEGLTLEHVLKDIETLNREAEQGTYELTAMSYHAYAHLHRQYAIFPVGSSIGDKYGPVVVANQPLTTTELVEGNLAIASPGGWTSAHLALKLWLPEANTVFMPFDRIQDAVQSGEVAAGVIIHEGQVTFADEGFHKVVDLGEWWFETTNLVLPLGCNGIRKDLPPELVQKLGRVLYRSVKWALDNREEALAGCMQYARGLSSEQADRFVGMYVNDMTLAMHPEIKKAVKLMLFMGHGMGLIPEKIEPEYVELALDTAQQAAPTH